MKAKKLTRKFFDRPTLLVAKELLGKFLIRKIGDEKIIGMITEVEAYVGPKDLASHATSLHPAGGVRASRGRTKRTEIMFGSPGYAYVYMIYGMYFCLNFVTEQEGYPAAVLIRGVQLKTENYKLKTVINGPGRICRHFQIDKSLNHEDVTKSSKLWVEDQGIVIKLRQIKRSKRINIDYAGIYKDKLWRFGIDGIYPSPVST